MLKVLDRRLLSRFCRVFERQSVLSWVFGLLKYPPADSLPLCSERMMCRRRVGVTGHSERPVQCQTKATVQTSLRCDWSDSVNTSVINITSFFIASWYHKLDTPTIITASTVKLLLNIHYFSFGWSCSLCSLVSLSLSYVFKFVYFFHHQYRHTCYATFKTSFTAADIVLC